MRITHLRTTFFSFKIKTDICNDCASNPCVSVPLFLTWGIPAQKAVCSGADQRKYESSASLALVTGIHRWVYSPHKGPVTWKLFPFDDVVMNHDDFSGTPHFFLKHCLNKDSPSRQCVQKTRRSCGRLSFIIGILILTRLHFYVNIERAPWGPSQ